MQEEVIEFFFFIHWKEVRFGTGFSLAVFSKTTEVEFVEQGHRSVGSVSTTVRSEGLIPLYGMLLIMYIQMCV